MESTRADCVDGEVIELAEGALYALVHPVELDGRLSWYPEDVRGFTPVTSYLLVEGEEALLVDTGLTVHRAALLAQLRDLLRPRTRLRILHTRLGEYGSICNTAAIVGAFRTTAVYGTFRADEWVDFEPRGAPAPDRSALWRGVDLEILGPEQTIVLGGNRRVFVFASPLRLLPTHWLHDEATGFLLTSDSFSHLVSDRPDGPWTTTAGDRATTSGELRAHLGASRYWWLGEADTGPIRRLLAERLGGLHLEAIGPGYGRILGDAATAARERELLDLVLTESPGGGIEPEAAAA